MPKSILWLQNNDSNYNSFYMYELSLYCKEGSTLPFENFKFLKKIKKILKSWSLWTYGFLDFIQCAAIIHFGGQIFLNLASGSLFKAALCFLTCPHHLEHLITFWHRKTLQAPDTPQLSNQLFPQESLFLSVDRNI